MADPMQDFIENFMKLSAFSEQQRQFDEQQALAVRQQEVAELGNFIQAAQFVENPAELGSLANFFAMRTPSLASALQDLTMQLVPSMATRTSDLFGEGLESMNPEQRTGAAQATVLRQAAGTDPGGLRTSQVQAGRSDEDILKGIETGERTRLSAGEQQQGAQWLQDFNRRVQEWMQEFGLQQQEFGLRRQLGFGELDLRRQGLNLERLGLLQRGELGQLGVMQQGGMLPMMLMGKLSEEARVLEQQLTGPLSDAARQDTARKLADINAQIGRLQQFQSVQVGSSADRLTQGDLPGLYRDLLGAVRSFDSKNAAEREAALSTYESIAEQIRSLGGNAAPAPAQPTPFWQRLPPIF